MQKYNTNALFHWYVREGMFNTSQYELFIHQGGSYFSRSIVLNLKLLAGGLTLPSKQLYSNPKNTAAFFKYLSSIVALLNGGDARSAKDDIQDLIDFESSLADITAREDNMTGMFVTLEKVDWIAKLGPDWRSWKDFVNDVIDEAFDGGDEEEEDYAYVAGDTEVWIQHGYMLELSKLINSLYNDTNNANSVMLEENRVGRRRERAFNTLNNYLVWRAIQPYVQYMNKGKVTSRRISTSLKY